MNPDQLWETTMNPETRLISQIHLHDAEEAIVVFSMLMKEEVSLAGPSHRRKCRLCNRIWMSRKDRIVEENNENRTISVDVFKEMRTSNNLNYAMSVHCQPCAARCNVTA